MSWKRRIGVGAVLVAVGGGIAYSFVPQPLVVDVVTVRRGPLAVTIEEEGKTRVIDRFVISAPVAGVAHRVELDVGDEVEAGQALVLLEPLRSTILDPRARARAEAHVEAARATFSAAQENTEAAEADATYWESEVARIRQLYAEKIAPQGRLDQAENEARRSGAAQRSANFAVQVAKYDLAAAQTELQYSTAEELPVEREQVSIHSPVAGPTNEPLPASSTPQTCTRILKFCDIKPL